MNEIELINNIKSKIFKNLINSVGVEAILDKIFLIDLNFNKDIVSYDTVSYDNYNITLYLRVPLSDITKGIYFLSKSKHFHKDNIVIQINKNIINFRDREIEYSIESLLESIYELI